MYTLYIYQIQKEMPMLKAHLKHLHHELRYNIDKDIEKILNIEIKYIEGLLRGMEKARKEMKLC
jgi:hypothetical protein